MSKLQDDFQWFCNTWKSEKDQAEKTGNYDEYLWFLKESKKDFDKLYVGMTNAVWIEFMGEVLKSITCEIKKIRIKYKESDGKQK